MRNHSTWQGMHFTTQEYTLCTNHDGPTIEEALRTVYGHMPKGVKFSYEKI